MNTLNKEFLSALEDLRERTTADLYLLSVLAQDDREGECPEDHHVFQNIKAAQSAIDFVIDHLEETERLRSQPTEAVMLRCMISQLSRAYKGRSLDSVNEPNVVIDHATNTRVSMADCERWLSELEAKEVSDEWRLNDGE